MLCVHVSSHLSICLKFVCSCERKFACGVNICQSAGCRRMYVHSLVMGDICSRAEFVCVCVRLCLPSQLIYRCQLLLFIFSSPGFVEQASGEAGGRPAAGILFGVSCYWQPGSAEEACHNLELELFCMCTAGELLLFVGCDSS